MTMMKAMTMSTTQTKTKPKLTRRTKRLVTPAQTQTKTQTPAAETGLAALNQAIGLTQMVQLTPAPAKTKVATPPPARSEPAPETPTEGETEQPVTPTPAPLIPPDTDVLGAVVKFVKIASAAAPGFEPLTDGQIIRGWQSLAVPPKAAEYCIVSVLTSLRHGTDAYEYDGKAAQEDPSTGQLWGDAKLSKFVEHTVQLDFCGSNTQVPIELTRRRAHLVETVANSTHAADIFQSINPNLNCLYADDVQSLPEMDDGHAVRHRHMLTLHIGERIDAVLPQEYLESMRVRVSDVTTYTP